MHWRQRQQSESSDIDIKETELSVTCLSQLVTCQASPLFFLNVWKVLRRSRDRILYIRYYIHI